jgi:hypothetical protein
MSDFSHSLVDQSISLADAPAEAERMIAWLQDRRIIGMTKDEDGEYRRGENFGDALTDDWRQAQSISFSLKVYTERRVFLPLENGERLHCPACGAEQMESNENWFEAVNRWHEGDDAASATCVGCGAQAPVTQWRCEAPWGFGNLGFEFNDWTLKSEFIAEFQRALGRPVVVVPCWC